MALQFGNTWWGNEWLKSLTHLDYENRIPRGAAYARSGKVEKITIQQNIITAKVAGSRPRPYNVQIVIPPFFEEEVNQLIDELCKYPNIISQLLNRELSPKVLDIAKNCGLKIFPERWTDFKMVCNCPDWAVPCKHLAAVIYMISREIDNNPFMVFSMHHVDLLQELENRGIFINDLKEETEVQTTKDLIKIAEHQIPEEGTQNYNFERIDFSVIEDCSLALFLLLTDRPPFSPSCNFKETYVKEVERLKKYTRQFLKKKLHIDGLIPSKEEITPLTTEDVVQLTLNYNMEWTIANSKYDVLSLSKALLSIHPDFLSDYHPTVIALHQALLCALHLLANGMIAPQIVELKNKSYQIRWNPAYADKKIQRITDQLEKMIPAGTLLLKPTPNARTLKEIIPQSEWMVSLFLGVLIHELSLKSNHDPLYQLFFKGTNNEFNEIGERETPGGIRAWTAAYTLKQSNFRPVFRIEENKTSGFDLHLSTEDLQHPEMGIVPLQEVMTSNDYKDKRLEILRGFTLISKMIREVNEYIDLGARKAIHYTLESFIPFLTEILPAMNMLDFKVFMPKSLQEIIHPKPTVNLKRKPDKEGGYLNLMSLFDFDWQIAMGDEMVNEEEFNRLTQEAKGLIKFKQQYIYIHPDDLQKIKNAFENTKQLTPAQLLQIALAEEYESSPIHLTPEAKELIQQITDAEEVPVPETLHATLRPYQLRGYSWMYHNMKIGFGSILADDMGLGKTIQVITLILKLKEEGALLKKHALIVVPTGLLTNWQSEIERFAPNLSACVYHGGNRDLKNFAADIMLTSYGVLRQDHLKLKKLKWTTMFIDEAQNIKNYETAQSKAVKSIPADIHIALSGTPVENRLTEYWSIMEFANKGYLGTVKDFKENFAKPIQIFNDKSCAERFRKITGPFMMRRMKTDKSIITDLPDKIELNDYALLKPEQASLYDTTLEAAMAAIEEIETTDNQSLFKRQGLILQMILALKQICNHPAQFLKNGDFRSELSGKAEMLLERIDTITENNEKVLIFTQFTEMGNLLSKFIEERTGKTPMFYHGGCSLKERQDMVERFQHNRNDNIFILSLKAAGTGLNLTAATHVIHYDLWWNPAVEAQATDRAYRIGQKKNVMVHRLITKNTFEEKIDNMIQQKKHLAEMTVASGENWIGKLSNKELREIFNS